MSTSSQSSLKQLQKEFMAFLREDEPQIGERVVRQGKVDNETRLGIYRNAYHVRLRETIETDHSELGTYLGDNLFEQMVEGYIQHYPSHFRSLRDFSERLPQFLSEQAPFSDHPVLADLARFERFLLYAFDAANTDTASLQDLIDIPAEQWPVLQLRFHPSLQLFRCHSNAVEIWQTLKAEQTPPPAEPLNACWLLWRNPERLTEFRSIETAELSMLEGFLQGQNFAEICEGLLAYFEEEAVGPFAVETLSQWLNSQLVKELMV